MNPDEGGTPQNGGGIPPQNGGGDIPKNETPEIITSGVYTGMFVAYWLDLRGTVHTEVTMQDIQLRLYF